MIIEVSDIRVKIRNRYILSDIYLTASSGKPAGVIGRNGQGKSTLFKAIFGSISCENASVRINNVNVKHPAFYSKQIHYLPQFSFFPNSISVDQALANFDSGFDDFENLFPEYRHLRKAKFSDLSGGEKRLIEVFAITKSPSGVKLLDEPFTYLSPIQREIVVNLIKGECSKKAFIITDHLSDYVSDICTHTYLLSDGKLRKSLSGE